MTTHTEIIEEMYQIVDAFLVEAKDQNGNERSLERLNKDRHLAVESLKEVLHIAHLALIEEIEGEIKKIIDIYGKASFTLDAEIIKHILKILSAKREGLQKGK